MSDSCQEAMQGEERSIDSEGETTKKGLLRSSSFKKSDSFQDNGKGLQKERVPSVSLIEQKKQSPTTERPEVEIKFEHTRRGSLRKGSMTKIPATINETGEMINSIINSPLEPLASTRNVSFGNDVLFQGSESRRGSFSKTNSEINPNFNLDIAVSTIHELQVQLIHANRTIEQLAAENVFLTKDLKKSRRETLRHEAKAVKQRQVAADMTPGARKILQETIEENTKMLTEFLEMMSKQENHAQAQNNMQESAYLTQREMKAKGSEEGKILDLLQTIKGKCDTILGGLGKPCPICVDRKKEEDKGKDQREEETKDSEIMSLKERVQDLEASLRESEEIRDSLKGKYRNRELKYKAYAERLQVQYEVLQKQALMVSLEYDKQCESFKKLQMKNDRVELCLEMARESQKDENSLLQQRLMDSGTQIAQLKEALGQKEGLLQTHLNIKHTITKELTLKRQELKEFKEKLEDVDNLVKQINNETMYYRSGGVSKKLQQFQNTISSLLGAEYE